MDTQPSWGHATSALFRDGYGRDHPQHSASPQSWRIVLGRCWRGVSLAPSACVLSLILGEDAESYKLVKEVATAKHDDKGGYCSVAERCCEVETAVSDSDFERRKWDMDMYHAYVLDSWTWAGKGWRLKAQLNGRQHKIFILDFFGSDKPHPNLGVPAPQHLTAFPTPPSQSRTFLGYSIDPSDLPSTGVAAPPKKRQGVIWGKSTASFKSGRNTQELISRLADYVELHSTVAPEDAPSRHPNIVYHGMVSDEDWRRLLQESKFMIGLGHPLSGPSAVDAVVAGCVYINPVYAKPMKNIYHSQHPFLQKSLGEPYVCSFSQKDVDGALDCARKALDQELKPVIPEELTKDAYDNRVRNIFGPLAENPTSQ